MVTISCSTDLLPYSFSPRLHNNISNVTSNVNFSPTTLRQLDGFFLVDYPIDTVCVIVCHCVCHSVYGVCHYVYGVCHCVYGVCHCVYDVSLCV